MKQFGKIMILCLLIQNAGLLPYLSADTNPKTLQPAFQCIGAPFILPSGNYISANYHYCRGTDCTHPELGYHQGIDIKQYNNGDQVNTPGIIPVYAPYAGVVRLGPANPVPQGMNIIHSSVGGQSVVYTYYAHMANSDRTQSYIMVNEGQWVEQGQLIGYMGNYGASSVHLHFSVNYPGMNEYDNNQDPSPFLGFNVNGNDGAQPGYVTSDRCFIQPIDSNIDWPTENASVRGQTPISGWAIHRSANNGTGIDAIHIYMDGQAGSGQWIGAANYGYERADVATIYGERFRYSGFSYNWDLTNVTSGVHTLYVYMHSTITGWTYVTRSVYVLPPIQQVVYLPLLRYETSTPPGAYAWLYWPRQDNYNFDIDLTITSAPSNANILFWAHQFGFVNGPGGYIGLQIVGNTHKAIFSIWDSLNGSAGCNAFSHEGSGWQCIINYNWQVGRTYKLRVWVLNKDVQNNEWWGAWIIDTVTGEEQHVGTILVPAGRGWLSSPSVTWIEYAGYTSCSVVYTRAEWSNPFVRNAAGDGSPSSAQVAYGNSQCPFSDVDSLGGTRYSIEAGEGVIRDTPEGSVLWP